MPDGWTKVAETPATPEGWTPVAENTSAPTFMQKLGEAAEKTHYGAGDFANPDHPSHSLLKLALHDISEGNYAKGANGLLSAASEFMKPGLPLTIGMAPITSALAFATGAAASKAGNALATSAGATPDQAQLAGNLGGLVAGYGTSKLSNLANSQSVAQNLYRSALKPSTTLPQPKVESMVNAGLREGIPVSASGSEKLGNLIDDINNQIKGKIQTSATQGVTVDPMKVASRLGDVGQQFGNQVNPTSDLAAVQKSGQEFMDTHPNPIPADEAQALKQGTYAQLKKKYGQLGSADIESQKALARGIKEELASQIPEIGDLNAKESELLGLDKALDRAVARISNHQVIGIGTPITAGAAKAVTGSTGIGAVAGLMKAILDDPLVKSKIAIAMSRNGVAPPDISSRIAAYSSALAGAQLADHQGSKQ